ncbi:hypothetical protein [Cystobacter fuscus]|nr:hypothetical protein [Cystobacter fuscus]
MAVVVLLNGAGAYAQGEVDAVAAAVLETALGVYYLDLPEGERLRVIFTLVAAASDAGLEELTGVVPGHEVRLIGVEYPDEVGRLLEWARRLCWGNCKSSPEPVMT